MLCGVIRYSDSIDYSKSASMVDYYNYKMSGSEEELESHTQPGMTKAELRRVKISLDFLFFFFFSKAVESWRMDA